MLRRRVPAPAPDPLPRGQRRPEDQPVHRQGVLRRPTLSIVADYVCYRYLRRPDDGNAGSRCRSTQRYYRQNVAEVLDVIDARHGAGPDRDRSRPPVPPDRDTETAGVRPHACRPPMSIGPVCCTAIRVAGVEQRFSPSVDAGLGWPEPPFGTAGPKRHDRADRRTGRRCSGRSAASRSAPPSGRRRMASRSTSRSGSPSTADRSGSTGTTPHHGGCRQRSSGAIRRSTTCVSRLRSRCRVT